MTARICSVEGCGKLQHNGVHIVVGYFAGTPDVVPTEAHRCDHRETQSALHA